MSAGVFSRFWTSLAASNLPERGIRSAFRLCQVQQYHKAGGRFYKTVNIQEASDQVKIVKMRHRRSLLVALTSLLRSSTINSATHIYCCVLQTGYQILLDKYPIRTPAKALLMLPNYPLALAVAAEWEWQVSCLQRSLGVPLRRAVEPRLPV